MSAKVEYVHLQSTCTEVLFDIIPVSIGDINKLACQGFKIVILTHDARGNITSAILERSLPSSLPSPPTFVLDIDGSVS